MIPEIFAGERRDGLHSISNEAARGVSIHGQKKRYEQVVCVPECLERLLADLLMRCGIHKEHAKKHYMACDTTRLGIVYLNSGLRADL